MVVKGTRLPWSLPQLSPKESAKQGPLSAIATTETNPDKVCNFQFSLLPASGEHQGSSLLSLRDRRPTNDLLCFSAPPTRDLIVLSQKHSKTAFLLTCLCALADHVPDTR